jgi:hypothetical protein
VVQLIRKSGMGIRVGASKPIRDKMVVLIRVRGLHKITWNDIPSKFTWADLLNPNRGPFKTGRQFCIALRRSIDKGKNKLLRI